MEVILLAGGLGTRLRSVVSDRPKPMAEVNGKPFLQHLMDFWIAQGASHFVLSVGYKHEVVVDYFGDNYRDIPVSYAIETKRLGTGGGMALALNKLRTDNTCAAQNGDTFFSVDVKSLLEFHKSKHSVFTLALREISDNSRYSSVALSPEGRVINFLPPANEASATINGGVYLLQPSNLKAVFEEKFSDKAFSLEDEFLPEVIQEQAFYAQLEKGFFIDIGVPEDYQRAQEVLK
jgi:D-glycero-alpha-D-manno-heptose 1-phosphate guanylyltransferase